MHCGQPVGGGGGGGGARVSGRAYDRPGVITLLSVLYFLSAGFFLLLTPFLGFAAVSETSSSSGPFAAGMAVVFGALGLLYGAAAVGLWNLKSYGRTLAIVFSAIGLLGFPIGTIISVLILVYLYKPGIKILFSGRQPSQLAPFEMAEVQKLQASGTSVAIIAVVVLLVGVVGVGIIAAIAIPSLLRARISANEASAIGDIRTMISAQQAYASSNGGYFDNEACLLTPTGCIPNYPPQGPTFLGAILSGVKNGYERTLHLGPPPETEAGDRSPSSVTSYAFVAVPATPGTTGVRAFCGDATGMLCTVSSGVEPAVTGGVCPATGCEPF